METRVRKGLAGLIAGRKVLQWREEPCKGPEAGSVRGLILPFSQASGTTNESWAGPLRALLSRSVTEWSPCNPRRWVYSLSPHFTDVETGWRGVSHSSTARKWVPEILATTSVTPAPCRTHLKSPFLGRASLTPTLDRIPALC